MNHEWKRDEYTISTNRERLDLNVIHGFLTQSYWAAGVPVEIVKRSIENSLPFGLYDNDRQIGFARVITDYATFAYLADVFVLEDARGAGLGKWLVAAIISHPELQGLRRWMLATRDAHGLYRMVGFESLKQPDRWMEKHEPDVYVKR
ncbi:MAG TPA: GNAT family N-acetyltransferase [Blastocatellia bacterium]|nr:GNAT family N-acetyltransferase [Blastocatellia bacterium]